VGCLKPLVLFRDAKHRKAQLASIEGREKSSGEDPLFTFCHC